MEQGQTYFVTKITSDLLDSETGKVRKVKEEKLVMGYNPTDVEAKVAKVYENYTMDWRITSITESKIDEVIE
jgi:hypothetical protein